MKKDNPRPITSFLEDDFELGSRLGSKRRKVVKPTVSKPIEVHKGTLLPNLVKSVLNDPPLEVDHGKGKQISDTKITKKTKRINRTKKATAKTDDLQLTGFKAFSFLICRLVIMIVAFAIALWLYTAIDKFITDIQIERLAKSPEFIINSRL